VELFLNKTKFLKKVALN